MNKNFYSLGLMSGTSIDGIDASIIRSDGEQFLEIIDDVYLKYDPKLRDKLKRTIDSCFSKSQLTKLFIDIKAVEKEMTIFHAKACKLIIKKNKKINVDLIGFHGQTILHKPKEGYSIQIGNSHLLSKMTNKIVVSNFRENDILHGGNGAPLVPLYHKLLSSKIKLNFPLAFINIGGISNITYIENKKKLISFDTGPGNYLIDQWIKRKSKMNFDNKGLIAQSGNLKKNILKKFLNDPYYNKKPPKSLDVKDFDLIDLNTLSLKDGCRTLSMLTVESICKSVDKLKKVPKNILFSGGGRKNKFIIGEIKNKINTPVYLIDEFNFDGDFIESQAFAYLAIRSFLKKVITLPETTGVKKPCTGGSIYKIKL